MSAPTPARIHPNARGGFDVNLSEEERDLLAILPGQMLTKFEQLDEHTEIPKELRRLFPPAYPTDASAENAYIRLVRDDILEHHRESLATLRDSAGVTHLDDQGIETWLSALTDLRLILGSELGVTEEEHALDPSTQDYFQWVCYHYLSQLQHEIVEVLSACLPTPITEGEAALPDDPWGDPLGGLRWDGTPLPESPQ